MVDPSAGNVLRLGSGLLFASLGAAVLVIGRRRMGALAFGAHLVTAGAWIVAMNTMDAGLVARVAFAVPIWCLGLAAGSLLPDPITRRERRALVLAITLPLLPILSTWIHAPGSLTLLETVNWTAAVATFLLPAFRLSMAASVDRKRVAQAAGLSLPGALWTGTVILPTGAPHLVSPFLAAVLLIATAAAPWLVAAHRGGGWAAVAVGWVILATAFSGYVIATFGRVVVGDDPYGFTGITRVAGWSAAAIAVLRADLLGVTLPRLSVKRGTVTTAVLASFFVAAEVAQNFLSDAYGLLMGGVVAGTLLFAARPLQRAVERLADGRSLGSPAAGPSDPANPTARREEVYLNAVRLALRDRRLTRAEEGHLTRLAEELGIGAGRAHDLLVQAEEETEAA